MQPFVRRLFLPTFFFAICAVQVPAAAQDIDHWETVVFDEDTWRYLVPTTEPDAIWRTLAFDDSAWPEGQGGFGYGDEDDRTVLEGAQSVFQRIVFSIEDTSAIAAAILHVDYDDGFVAYLNDTEIARGGIGVRGDRPAFNQPASSLHEALLYQGGTPPGFQLSKTDLTDLWQEGDNLLAVQTHNDNPNSSDLSSRVFLSVGLTSATGPYRPTPSWFAPPITTPGQLNSNLPIVVIDTEGQFIPDEPKIFARMGIIDNGPDATNQLSDFYNAYDGLVGIERRGASSQSFPKLSYAVETRAADSSDLDVSLLGFPEEEDWILHGPYSDKSLVRNVMIYELARRMGRYASRTRFVELVLNNDYRGVYVLMEKIKRDKNRVDISKLNPEEITGDDLTGGYIVKIDKVSGGETEGWHSPYAPRTGLQQRVFYQYHYPKPSDIAPEQRDYIRDVIADFEAVMVSEDFADPDTGYPQYIDVDSAVDFCILNEIARNVDGYRLSTFLYKDKDSVGDGKLVFGPIWDFNLSFGNADYYSAGLREGFQIQTPLPSTDGFMPPFWWEKLWREPAFNARVMERWQELRQGPLHSDSLTQFIDQQAALLQDAAPRNFERWNILGTYIWPNAFVGNTYAQELDFMKSWLSDRVSWIDAHLQDVTLPTAPTLPPFALQRTVIFPNPLRSRGEFTLTVGSTQYVRIAIYDVLGRRVAEVFDDLLIANESETITFDTSNLASGVYFIHTTSPFVSDTQRIAVQ